MEKDALSLVKDEFYPLKKEKGHIYELISGKRGSDIEIQINIFLESSQFTPSKESRILGNPFENMENNIVE